MKHSRQNRKEVYFITKNIKITQNHLNQLL